ncbi:MAG: hypothetical protein II839_04720 [Kiritimatiellae bacterium]|nr:hypothetical protein [Kiritimatiellia bacterium]
MVVELSGGFAVVGAGAWLFGRAQPAAVRGTLKSRSLKGFVCPDRAALTRGELADDYSHAESAESAEFAESSSNDLESPLRGPETSGEAASPKETPRTPRTPRDDTQNETPRTPRTPRDDQNPEHGARAWCASSACPFLTRIDCGAPVSAVSDKVLVAPAAARTGARLVKLVPLSFSRSIRVTEFASEWVVTATRSRTTRVVLAEGESLGVRPGAAVAWTGPRPTGFCPRLRLLDVLLPRGPRDLLLHFHGPAIVWIEGAEPLPLRKAAPRKAVF